MKSCSRDHPLGASQQPRQPVKTEKSKCGETPQSTPYALAVQIVLPIVAPSIVMQFRRFAHSRMSPKPSPNLEFFPSIRQFFCHPIIDGPPKVTSRVLLGCSVVTTTMKLLIFPAPVRIATVHLAIAKAGPGTGCQLLAPFSEIIRETTSCRRVFTISDLLLL